MIKSNLANSFAMKELGATKKILGMIITRDRKKLKLILSQGEYIEKVFDSQVFERYCYSCIMFWRLIHCSTGIC